MTRSPDKYADPPDFLTGQPDRDALSELLHTVRLRVRNVVRCAPARPFNIDIPRGVRALHMSEMDGLRISVGGRHLVLNEGDMVMLVRGDAHAIAYGRATPSRGLAAADLTSGCDGTDAAWMTGTFAVDSDVADPLLAVLPPAVVVNSGQPGTEWLALSMKLLRDELITPSPGAWIMMARILDLLLIRALREWSTETDTEPGWLTAAMDAELSEVLSAIQHRPEKPWTVTELAQLAGLSRSTFAERFTKLLGQSPGAYVTGQRLDRAAVLLRSTKLSVSKVGHAVGYTSDAAFSRAFQRQFGQSPLRYRSAGA